MTAITLQPITITFTQTSKFSVEDYLEWCEMTKNIPSQKGYKRYVIYAFEDDLRDDIDTNNFTFKYGKEKDYEYEETEVDGNETPFDYSKYVSDLSKTEIEKFSELAKIEDKFSINPLYTKDDIIILNSIENLSLYYGVKINKKTGTFLCIKKSIHTHHLYEYLKALPELAQQAHPEWSVVPYNSMTARNFMTYQFFPKIEILIDSVEYSHYMMRQNKCSQAEIDAYREVLNDLKNLRKNAECDIFETKTKELQ